MIKAILAIGPVLVTGLGMAFKFKWLAPLLGPIGPLLVMAVEGLIALAKAFILGFCEILGDWKRVFATLVVAGFTLAAGVHLGILASAEVTNAALASAKAWKTAHGKVITDAKQVKADHEKKFEAAVQARVVAEKNPEVKHVKTVPIAVATGPQVRPGVQRDRAAGARRVLRKAKPKSASGDNPDGGQGLFAGWVYGVFGGPLELDPGPKKVGRGT